MFSESAELYDLIYSGFKDYGAEAAQIAALLRTVHPECRTLLDVACGTGEHARRLAVEHGFLADGIDLDSAFVQIARRKHPAGRFTVADMTDFRLPDRYDVITCLFSSIGYARSLDRVERALRCFRDHLASGGVILVEPWFPPGRLEDGYVSRNRSEAHGIRVERVARTVIDGRLSRLTFDYEIAEGDTVRHATEIHELGLFTPEEMADAFTASGLAVEYDPVGLIGRGLYVARRRLPNERDAEDAS